MIHGEQPQGYDFFPSLLAFGKSYAHHCFHPATLWSYRGLVGGHSIPYGLYWIEMNASVSIVSAWRLLLLSVEWRYTCKMLVSIINVLYSRESQRVTMIDLEHYSQCTPEHLQTLEANKLFDIVEDSWLKELRWVWVVMTSWFPN